MKLHCLRVQFHTNMRKIELNHTAAESWWCFKDLMFLKDYVVIRKKMVDGVARYNDNDIDDDDDLEIDLTNNSDFSKMDDVKVNSLCDLNKLSCMFKLNEILILNCW